MLLLAFTGALTPWSIAYVMLPQEWQKHHLTVYWVSAAILTLGLLRIYLKANKQTDQAIQSSESLFESMTQMSSDDPEVRKKAAAQMVQQLQQMESEGDWGELSQEQKQFNINRNFKTLKKLSIACHQAGIKVRTGKTKELQQIAEDYSHNQISIKQALVELMVDHQASLWVEMEDFEGIYAQIIGDIIKATQRDMKVNNLQVEMNEQSCECLLSFEFDEQVFRWKFRQKGHYVAQSFLNKALNFFAQRAGGRFVFIDSEDAYADYLFIPSALYGRLFSRFVNKDK